MPQQKKKRPKTKQSLELLVQASPYGEVVSCDGAVKFSAMRIQVADTADLQSAIQLVFAFIAEAVGDYVPEPKHVKQCKEKLGCTIQLGDRDLTVRHTLAYRLSLFLGTALRQLSQSKRKNEVSYTLPTIATPSAKETKLQLEITRLHKEIHDVELMLEDSERKHKSVQSILQLKQKEDQVTDSLRDNVIQLESEVTMLKNQTEKLRATCLICPQKYPGGCRLRIDANEKSRYLGIRGSASAVVVPAGKPVVLRSMPTGKFSLVDFDGLQGFVKSGSLIPALPIAFQKNSEFHLNPVGTLRTTPTSTLLPPPPATPPKKEPGPCKGKDFDLPTLLSPNPAVDDTDGDAGD